MDRHTHSKSDACQSRMSSQLATLIYIHKHIQLNDADKVTNIQHAYSRQDLL